MNELGYVRKDRRDGVTGETVPGPTHRTDPHGYTLCGVRMKGFTVRTSEAGSDLCASCERHHAAGTQGSWRGGR